MLRSPVSLGEVMRMITVRGGLERDDLGYFYPNFAQFPSHGTILRDLYRSFARFPPHGTILRDLYRSFAHFPSHDTIIRDLYRSFTTYENH